MGRVFLGVGIRYPHDVTELGRIALQDDLALVRQSIKRILQTRAGDQFMNRDFGSYVNELMFEQNDSILFALLDFHIVDAIDRWEKRARPLEVEIQINAEDPARVDVGITYEILSSGEIDSFIYPFYRELTN